MASMEKIEAIRYTSNLQLGTFDISRSWEWEPKTKQVTNGGKIKTASRSRLLTNAPSSVVRLREERD